MAELLPVLVEEGEYFFLQGERAAVQVGEAAEGEFAASKNGISMMRNGTADRMWTGLGRALNVGQGAQMALQAIPGAEGKAAARYINQQDDFYNHQRGGPEGETEQEARARPRQLEMTGVDEKQQAALREFNALRQRMLQLDALMRAAPMTREVLSTYDDELEKINMKLQRGGTAFNVALRMALLPTFAGMCHAFANAAREIEGRTGRYTTVNALAVQEFVAEMGAAGEVIQEVEQYPVQGKDVYGGREPPPFRQSATDYVTAERVTPVRGANFQHLQRVTTPKDDEDFFVFDEEDFDRQFLAARDAFGYGSDLGEGDYEEMVDVPLNYTPTRATSSNAGLFSQAATVMSATTERASELVNRLFSTAPELPTSLGEDESDTPYQAVKDETEQSSAPNTWARVKTAFTRSPYQLRPRGRVKHEQELTPMPSPAAPLQPSTPMSPVEYLDREEPFEGMLGLVHDRPSAQRMDDPAMRPIRAAAAAAGAAAAFVFPRNLNPGNPAAAKAAFHAGVQNGLAKGRAVVQAAQPDAATVRVATLVALRAMLSGVNAANAVLAAQGDAIENRFTPEQKRQMAFPFAARQAAIQHNMVARTTGKRRFNGQPGPPVARQAAQWARGQRDEKDYKHGGDLPENKFPRSERMTDDEGPTAIDPRFAPRQRWGTIYGNPPGGPGKPGGGPGKPGKGGGGRRPSKDEGGGGPPGPPGGNGPPPVAAPATWRSILSRELNKIMLVLFTGVMVADVIRRLQGTQMGELISRSLLMDFLQLAGVNPLETCCNPEGRVAPRLNTTILRNTGVRFPGVPTFQTNAYGPYNHKLPSLTVANKAVANFRRSDPDYTRSLADAAMDKALEIAVRYPKEQGMQPATQFHAAAGVDTRRDTSILLLDPYAEVAAIRLGYYNNATGFAKRVPIVDGIAGDLPQTISNQDSNMTPMLQSASARHKQYTNIVQSLLH